MFICFYATENLLLYFCSHSLHCYSHTAMCIYVCVLMRDMRGLIFLLDFISGV